MLTVPADRSIGNITIYRDDTLFYRYYAIADRPRLCLDEHGDPALLLVKYELSDDDRAAHPDLPRGGGRMTLDTTFEPSEEERATVTAALQPVVDAEWHRLRASPEPADSAREGVSGTTAPPAVELATPTWTKGHAALLISSDELLVEDAVVESDVSLLTGNRASFSIDLTPAGATFMHGMLAKPDGTAASGRLPAQVRYSLCFMARLPDVTMHVRVDSKKVHEYVRQQMGNQGWASCTPYDVEHASVEHASMLQSAAVTISFGDAPNVPDDVKDQLRTYALELVKSMVKSTLLEPLAIGSGADSQAGTSTDTAAPAVPGQRWQLREYESAAMSMDFTMAQQSIVDWEIRPNATLDTMVEHTSSEQLGRLVKQVSLEDPFFETLTIKVQAALPSDPEFSHLDVELRHTGLDGDGRPREAGEAFSLTDATPHVWSVGMIGTSRAVDYRHRPVFRGRPVGDWTAWKPTGEQLSISLPEPGTVRVEAFAQTVDFDKVVRLAEVEIAYEDDASGIAREERSFVLDAKARAATYTRRIWVEPLATPTFRTRFTYHTGDRSDWSDWQPTQGGQAIVSPPTESLLEVTLLPTGSGWDHVGTVIVELSYEDQLGGIAEQESFVLSSREQMATWRVFLRDRTNRAYRYRWRVSYKSGKLVENPWREADARTDPTLPIVVERGGTDVTLIADTLDFSVCPLTEVTLHSTGSGFEKHETFVFRDKKPQIVHFDTPTPNMALECAWRVTHYPSGRTPVTMEGRDGDGMIVIPPYLAPSHSTLRIHVKGDLVNYDATPYVLVELGYLDASGALVDGTSVMLDKTKCVDVGQITTTAGLRRTGYQITHYTASSEAHVGLILPAQGPLVVVPNLS